MVFTGPRFENASLYRALEYDVEDHEDDIKSEPITRIEAAKIIQSFRLHPVLK